jgi:outer membrane translocation and assembly module TamA
MVGGSDLVLRYYWSGLEIIDFYGLGNESVASGPTSFHRTPHKRIEMSMMLGFGDGESRQLGIGPVIEYISTDTSGTASYLRTAQPYGSGRFTQVGLRTVVELDRRDRLGTPSRGYRLEGGGTYFPGLISVDRGAFGEVHGQATAYVSPPGGSPTLALRVQGKKVWGTYPFSESAFLGGQGSLRGLHEQRYAGSMSLLGSAELRVDVARILLVLPTDFGLLGLVDVGRVFHDEESSRWRTGFGGGIWLAPLRRSSTVHFTVARAEGRNAIYLGVGLPF